MYPPSKRPRLYADRWVPSASASGVCRETGFRSGARSGAEARRKIQRPSRAIVAALTLVFRVARESFHPLPAFKTHLGHRGQASARDLAPLAWRLLPVGRRRLSADRRRGHHVDDLPVVRRRHWAARDRGLVEVTIDQKHRDGWHGTLSARLMIVTNVLPGLIDAAGVFASRFMVLRFGTSFYGREDTTLDADREGRRYEHTRTNLFSELYGLSLGLSDCRPREGGKLISVPEPPY